MKAPPALLLLAAAALLLAASLLPWLPGLSLADVWSPGGPDAPEPPLSDVGILWTASAIALGAAGFRARPPAPVWASLSGRDLAIAAGICAAYLAAQTFLQIPEFSILVLVGALPFLWRAQRRLYQAGLQQTGQSSEWAHAAIGFAAGASALSLSFWMPWLIRGATGFGPSDAPWISFWIAFLHVWLLSWGFLKRTLHKRWLLFALSWGAAAAVWHNWTSSGLHLIALLTGLLSALLLTRVTWPRKHPKPVA